MPRLAWFLVTFLLFFRSLSAPAQETLVISGIEKSSYATISERVMREAYGRMGITVEFSGLPAERALVVADSGRVDGELYRIKNVHLKYPNLIMLPVPIGIMEGIAITTDPGIELKNWDDLGHYSVCIRTGVKFAEAGTRHLQVQTVNSNELMFQMLGLERCDVIVLARLTSIALAQEFSRRENKPVQYHLLQTYPLFHYLHKKNAHLVPELTTVLEAMKSEGRIAAIRAAYIEEISSIY
ncbi:substrate-binding periplasmic protein [Aestuariispira insulae]|uniref:Extracellular solute-binding protein (Family 3) n=1 Tax=Aestuariispira insulae TaxID=1461337 RepID=A0A3D9HK62_9PROT|nr:transporter substrate-binding domain-containing protein [Aestuariispira insulae]RED49854.1 extracellular solute-binding protein (family 3) [Aestuariispira insulae]